MRPSHIEFETKSQLGVRPDINVRLSFILFGLLPAVQPGRKLTQKAPFTGETPNRIKRNYTEEETEQSREETHTHWKRDRHTTGWETPGTKSEWLTRRERRGKVRGGGTGGKRLIALQRELLMVRGLSLAPKKEVCD